MSPSDEDPTEFVTVTPPLLVALGYVLVQGGDLEDAMIETTWIATKLRRSDVLTLVRGQTMGVLKNTFLEKYRAAISDQSLLGQLDVIEQRLGVAVDLRNEFVHASWRAEHAKGRYPVLRKRIPRDGAREEITAVSPEEILEAAGVLEEVAGLIWELAAATATVTGEPPPEYQVLRQINWELPQASTPAPPRRRAPPSRGRPSSRTQPRGPPSPSTRRRKQR